MGKAEKSEKAEESGKIDEAGEHLSTKFSDSPPNPLSFCEERGKKERLCEIK